MWFGHVVEPELALVAACSVWPSDGSTQDRIRQCIRSTRDWNRFLGQVSRHRVTSLVFNTLSSAHNSFVPPAVIERLGSAARSQARLTMRQIAETARLTRMLGNAGIGSLVLKGPVLSAIAFEDSTLRDSRDIDLIVRAEELNRVDTIIGAEGYRRQKPKAGMSARQLAWYRHWVHEFSYYSPTRNVLLEVKDRVDRMGSVPASDIVKYILGPRMVDLGGLDLATLPDVDLFLYLCAHGSRHAWFRLKWIADIGAMLHRMSPSEIGAVVKRAAELDVERCFHTALLLAREVLISLIPEPALAQANADAGARRCAAAASKCLAFFGRDGDPFSSVDFTTRLFLAEYRIRSDWAYRWTVLLRHALSYGYPLLRPVIRMAEKLRWPA